MYIVFRFTFSSDITKMLSRILNAIDSWRCWSILHSNTRKHIKWNIFLNLTFQCSNHYIFAFLCFLFWKYNWRYYWWKTFFPVNLKSKYFSSSKSSKRKKKVIEMFNFTPQWRIRLLFKLLFLKCIKFNRKLSLTIMKTDFYPFWQLSICKQLISRRKFACLSLLTKYQY